MVRYTREFKVRVILSFIFALIFLLSSLMIGKLVTDMRAEKMNQLENEIRTLLDDFELLVKLRENICSSRDYSEFLSRKLDEEGIKISALEEKYGKNHPKIIGAKKLYSLLLIKHLLAIQELNKKCEGKYVVILFFYSNKKEFRDKSEDQGIILGFIKNKYKERVKIYALDVDLGLATIDFLKEKYNVNNIPSLVINGVTHAYKDKKEIEKILSQFTTKLTPK